MELLTIIIFVIILAVVIKASHADMYNWFLWLCGCDEKKSSENKITKKDIEKFGGNGALQSLYSNDGIQDIHLTVNNDTWGDGYGWGGAWGGYGWGYDPYRYWRGIPWYLPTRNLSRVAYYPYLYEYYLDRYGRFYPYW